MLKVAALSTALDKLNEQKEAIDEILLKASPVRAAWAATRREAEAAAKELKGFNAALRAEFQAKGKPFPGDLSAEAYTQYKSGFFKLAAASPSTAWSPMSARR